MSVAAWITQVVLVATLLVTTAGAGLRWHAVHGGYGSVRAAVAATVAVVVCAVAVFVYPFVGGWWPVWLVGLVLVSVAVSVAAVWADRGVYQAWVERLRGGPGA